MCGNNISLLIMFDYAHSLSPGINAEMVSFFEFLVVFAGK